MYDILFASIGDGARSSSQNPGSQAHRTYSAICRHYMETISPDAIESTKCVLLTINSLTQVDDAKTLFAIAGRNKMIYMIGFIKAPQDVYYKQVDHIRTAIAEAIENDPCLSAWTELPGVFREATVFVRT